MKINVFGDWVQGVAHLRNGIEWQDHYRKIDYIKGVYIVAVADGHGSDKCPYSSEGSRVATKVFCNLMADYYKNYDDTDVLKSFLNREGDTKVALEIEREWKREIRELHLREKRLIASEDEIYILYGTTLLGTMIFDNCVFTFQIGDGNIAYADAGNVYDISEADDLASKDKPLGVETHSLSGSNCWKHAITGVNSIDETNTPVMYMLSTDGMLNSHASHKEFLRTVRDYYELINVHGIKTIKNHLRTWFQETSEGGCGDDITVMFIYMN